MPLLFEGLQLVDRLRARFRLIEPQPASVSAIFFLVSNLGFRDGTVLYSPECSTVLHCTRAVCVLLGFFFNLPCVCPQMQSSLSVPSTSAAFVRSFVRSLVSLLSSTVHCVLYSTVQCARAESEWWRASLPCRPSIFSE